jgi:hypothetical protein
MKKIIPWEDSVFVAFLFYQIDPNTGNERLKRILPG